MTLRVLIADDEQLARTRLERLLGAMDDVAIAGSCADGDQVIQRVKAGDVDVVLLDIHMPHLSGTDAAALLPKSAQTQIVFCTAHDDQAVHAFALGAVDYLLKPVSAERLAVALSRVRERMGAAKPAGGPIARIPVSTRHGLVLVDPAKVTHAALDGELITLHTLDGPLLCDLSLRELGQRLGGGFVRVHRGALLNLAHVSRLEPLESGGYLAHTVSGGSVSVSRQAARELRRTLGLRKTSDDEP